MKSTARKNRPHPAQRAQVIIESARTIAESEGWAAVTVRRLADAIGYSQPVLYQHFPGGRREVVAEVSRVGFAELAELVSSTDATSESTLVEAARAYLTYASEHEALYTAMFELPSQVRFASDETPAELRRSFEKLAEILGDHVEPRVRTEVFWSALHGIATLERDGRLPASLRDARLDELARIFS